MEGNFVKMPLIINGLSLIIFVFIAKEIFPSSTEDMLSLLEPSKPFQQNCIFRN